MINIKKSLITLTILSITCSSSYAASALCESELLGANQQITSGAKLTEQSKNNLKTCLPRLEACGDYDLKYNCQYIYNEITKTAAVPSTHTQGTQQAPIKVVTPTPNNNLQAPQPIATKPGTPQQKTTIPASNTNNKTNQPTQEPAKQNQINWL